VGALVQLLGVSVPSRTVSRLGGVLEFVAGRGEANMAKKKQKAVRVEADRPIPYVPNEGPFEAKRVDARYFLALEDLLDAVEILFETSLSEQTVTRARAAFNIAADMAPRQDRYRTDREVGPRSLKRFEKRLVREVGPQKPTARSFVFILHAAGAIVSAFSAAVCVKTGERFLPALMHVDYPAGTVFKVTAKKKAGSYFVRVASEAS
jgi:hypothetical protein